MNNNNFTKFPDRTARIEFNDTVFQSVADLLPVAMDDAAKTLDDVTVTNPGTVDAYFVSKDKAETPVLGEHVVIEAGETRVFSKLNLDHCYVANADAYTGEEPEESPSESESETEGAVLEIVGTPAAR
jgi:hypothetical protein